MDRGRFDLAIIRWPQLAVGDTREAMQRLRAARDSNRKLAIMPGGYGYYFFRDWILHSAEFRAWVDRLVAEAPWSWDLLEDRTAREFRAARNGVPRREPAPWTRIRTSSAITPAR